MAFVVKDGRSVLNLLLGWLVCCQPPGGAQVPNVSVLFKSNSGSEATSCGQIWALQASNVDRFGFVSFSSNLSRTKNTMKFLKNTMKKTC